MNACSGLEGRTLCVHLNQCFNVCKFFFLIFSEIIVSIVGNNVPRIIAECKLTVYYDYDY